MSVPEEVHVLRAPTELFGNDRQPVVAVETSVSRPALTLPVKLLYAVGSIGDSIKAFTFGVFLLFYYASVLGLPGTLVGIGASIGLVWDALVDPYIGHLSDCMRLRYGGRHSFMLVGALSMGLSFFAIFNPPAGLSNGGLFVWLMLTSLLLRTSSSIFMVPYYALGVELSQDYHERTSITAFRAAAALFGTLLAASLSFVVFFPITTPGVDPKFDRSGYVAMALAFGAVMTVAGLTATVGTWLHRRRAVRRMEGVPETTDHQPMITDHSPAGVPVRFSTGIVLAVRNRTFLALTLASSLFFVASVTNATLALHYLTYYAGITASGSLSAIQLAFYIGALVGVPCWLRASRVIDKHRLYFAAVVCTALVMAGAYGLIGAGRLFGTGNVLPLLIGNSIAGLVASALWVLPHSMLADITDMDRLASGHQREGTFAGLFSFSTQASASVAVLLTGILIDNYAALVPGQTAQSALTIQRLAVLYSLLPAGILFVAAFIILRYDLSQRRVRAIQAELQ